MAAATEKATVNPEVVTHVKSADSVPFQDFRQTDDGKVWAGLKSQGQKIPVCGKCGSKRLVDDVYVNQGKTIATLRCPNNDLNCTFIKEYEAPKVN